MGSPPVVEAMDGAVEDSDRSDEASSETGVRGETLTLSAPRSEGLAPSPLLSARSRIGARDVRLAPALALPTSTLWLPSSLRNPPNLWPPTSL